MGRNVILSAIQSLDLAPSARKQTMINPHKIRMGKVNNNFLLEKINFKDRLKIYSTSFQVINPHSEMKVYPILKIFILKIEAES